MRILVVENHVDTLKCITLYLEQLGHSVQAVESMREALAAADGATFDALISDIGLPDGDGWELSRRAKFAQPVFAIAISGYGTAADRARSIAAGYRYHVVKPLDIELLDNLLEEVAREAPP